MNIKRPNIIFIIIGIQVVVGLIIFFAMKGSEDENGEVEVDNSEPKYITAIAIAEDFLISIDRDPAEYEVIKIENLVTRKGIYQGPHIWHITFKRADLVPDNEYDMVGAGGEIFISVNVKERRAELLGYGE
jgi:hypothetical protein